MDDPVEIALRRKKTPPCAWPPSPSGRARRRLRFRGQHRRLDGHFRYVLKTLDGIDRPAIATSIPNQTGRATTVLDLGANVDCTAEHLLQFAIMGAALTQAVDHRDNPTVGLLNIGEEVIKGNEVVKEAAELLRSSPLNFYGVEGNDIFKGTVDVVVCDGFVGNVVLKSVEGLAKMLSSVIARNSSAPLITLLAGKPGAQPPAQPRRQSPLQRRRLAGLAWRRDQEPRFGGRLCLRFRPQRAAKPS